MVGTHHVTAYSKWLFLMSTIVWPAIGNPLLGWLSAVCDVMCVVMWLCSVMMQRTGSQVQHNRLRAQVLRHPLLTSLMLRPSHKTHVGVDEQPLALLGAVVKLHHSALPA